MCVCMGVEWRSSAQLFDCLKVCTPSRLCERWLIPIHALAPNQTVKTLLQRGALVNLPGLIARPCVVLVCLILHHKSCCHSDIMHTRFCKQGDTDGLPCRLHACVGTMFSLRH